MPQRQTIVEMSPICVQDQPGSAQRPQQAMPIAAEDQQLGWEGNDSGTLLVIVTLITTLTYQIGCNPPGGFWQDDDVKNGYVAGTPIMRDKFKERYWLFLTAAWVGFGASMLLTMWLLIGAPVKSRRVRWSFIVSYSSLQLTYITAMFGTSLAIALATWGGLMLFLSLLVGLEKRHQKLTSPCLKGWLFY